MCSLPTRPLVRRLLEAQCARDMPMIILFSRNDPEACRGLAMQMLGDDAGCRLAKSTANVTLAAADRGKCERRVAVDEAYTPSGCLLLDVDPVPAEGAPGQNVQAGQVEVAKGAAVLRQVDMRRRGIVVHRADRLARHLQHALRKIIESTSTSAVFVLTSQRLEGMDPALLSRAIVVNCTTAALAPAPPPSVTPGRSTPTSRCSPHVIRAQEGRGARRAKVIAPC